jgi:hypothetical protein
MRKHKPNFSIVGILLVFMAMGAWFTCVLGVATVEGADTEDRIVGILLTVACAAVVLLGPFAVWDQVRGPRCLFKAGDLVVLAGNQVKLAQSGALEDGAWDVTNAERYQGRNGTVFGLKARRGDLTRVLVVQNESLVRASRPLSKQICPRERAWPEPHTGTGGNDGW